jgi:hypothetical protein
MLKHLAYFCGLLYNALGSSTMQHGIEMKEERLTGKNFKGSGSSLIGIISRHLPGG